VIIQDLLLLRAEELKTLQAEYPGMTARPVNSGSTHSDDRYLIEVPTDDEEGYYIFLFDNFLLMASQNFMAKLEKDQEFRVRMTQRLAE
jgi:hypothetical protein